MLWRIAQVRVRLYSIGAECGLLSLALFPQSSGYLLFCSRSSSRGASCTPASSITMLSLLFNVLVIQNSVQGLLTNGNFHGWLIRAFKLLLDNVNPLLPCNCLVLTLIGHIKRSAYTLIY